MTVVPDNVIEDADESAASNQREHPVILVGVKGVVGTTAVIGIYLEIRKHLEMFANLMCDSCDFYGLESKHLRLHLPCARDYSTVIVQDAAADIDVS